MVLMLSVAVFGLILNQIATLPQKPMQLKGAVDLSGRASVLSMEEAKATVLVFITHECPIANRYAPEIGRIYEDYRLKKVNFYRVYVGEKSLAKEFVQHGKDFGLKMPGLIDPEFKLVIETGVTVTPEVAVFDSKRVLRYRGRIDNQNVEHGKVRPEYRRDLRVALDEMLAGQPVSLPMTAAVGCFINRE
jgi:thiol-disulfide isomerase/thioredoxin